ncbi:hypothetical protein TRFO_34417 [Tritrichomonas foetus]|uniref:Protein kinase domain-containing protein n=1 Tax=Tritrichomonas foetus TaxID=1144522 RepID=A0A1J4JKL1_9EUKA|nr:hypothetical protein TRFO_34417 [Tritrichomonas foetus]|eukprot:OHS99177.1 hypothetical protein TRFO_34417 [Tritrichomonas foetus]
MFATMATGGSPWQCDSLGELKSLAAQGTMSFKKPIPDIIKDLIYKCVVVDPSQRLTMKQITQHPIFGQPKMPKRRFLSSSQKYGSKQKIQWENITRNVCSENSDSFDMNIEEDFMNSLRLNDNSFGNLGPNGAYGLVPGLVPVKTTSIHTASSIFLHSARKKTNVKGRLKRKKNLRPTVFETFAEIEEVNEE